MNENKCIHCAQNMPPGGVCLRCGKPLQSPRTPPPPTAPSPAEDGIAGMSLGLLVSVLGVPLFFALEFKAMSNVNHYAVSLLFMACTVIGGICAVFLQTLRGFFGTFAGVCAATSAAYGVVNYFLHQADGTQSMGYVGMLIFPLMIVVGIGSVPTGIASFIYFVSWFVRRLRSKAVN